MSAHVELTYVHSPCSITAIKDCLLIRLQQSVSILFDCPYTLNPSCLSPTACSSPSASLPLSPSPSSPSPLFTKCSSRQWPSDPSNKHCLHSLASNRSLPSRLDIVVVSSPESLIGISQLSAVFKVTRSLILSTHACLREGLFLRDTVFSNVLLSATEGRRSGRTGGSGVDGVLSVWGDKNRTRGEESCLDVESRDFGKVCERRNRTNELGISEEGQRKLCGDLVNSVNALLDVGKREDDCDVIGFNYGEIFQVESGRFVGGLARDELQNVNSRACSQPSLYPISYTPFHLSLTPQSSAHSMGSSRWHLQTSLGADISIIGPSTQSVTKTHFPLEPVWNQAYKSSLLCLYSLKNIHTHSGTPVAHSNVQPSSHTSSVCHISDLPQTLPSSSFQPSSMTPLISHSSAHPSPSSLPFSLPAHPSPSSLPFSLPVTHQLACSYNVQLVPCHNRLFPSIRTPLPSFNPPKSPPTVYPPSDPSSNSTPSAHRFPLNHRPSSVHGRGPTPVATTPCRPSPSQCETISGVVELVVDTLLHSRGNVLVPVDATLLLHLLEDLARALGRYIPLDRLTPIYVISPSSTGRRRSVGGVDGPQVRPDAQTKHGRVPGDEGRGHGRGGVGRRGEQDQTVDSWLGFAERCAEWVNTERRGRTMKSPEPGGAFYFKLMEEKGRVVVVDLVDRPQRDDEEQDVDKEGPGKQGGREGGEREGGDVREAQTREGFEGVDATRGEGGNVWDGIMREPCVVMWCGEMWDGMISDIIQSHNGEMLGYKQIRTDHLWMFIVFFTSLVFSNLLYTVVRIFLFFPYENCMIVNMLGGFAAAIT
eukprot:GHVQ01014110.1.p1 GENE.GHVQ01014110.1~~GHVQ01014110.1.p1  ORF type:complete len:819 (+),score=111.15 GHVQ01014110.1:122-2578(+)